MGERIRNHITARLPLQPVIADGTGRSESLFDLTGFEPVVALLRVMCPDAGQTVGLEFLAHQQPGRAFDIVAALPQAERTWSVKRISVAGL